MKAKFGAIVVAGSGKINGFVASRNRAGAYFRTKVTPVNPSSTAQSTVRSRLGSISQAWRGLTEAQRASWNAAVANFARTDIFGDLKNPSGFNLFQRLNNNLLQTGTPINNTAPQVEAVGAVGIVSLVGDESASTLVLTLGGNVPSDTSLVIEATPQLSAGINFVKSEYRVLTVKAAATATPIALGADYEAMFGDLIAGQKIFVRLKFINTNTGQNAPYLSESTIVIA